MYQEKCTGCVTRLGKIDYIDQTHYELYDSKNEPYLPTCTMF